VEIIAKHLNRFNTNFKHITDDVNNVDMSEYDVIINTSCEHIADDSWFHKINKHALVILHSTNLKADDHYNTCNSLIEMTNKYPMDYRYTGELLLDTYSRYMVIGYVL
jgi:hypothetical protein